MARALSICVLFTVIILSSQVACAQRWERLGRRTAFVQRLPVQTTACGADNSDSRPSAQPTASPLETDQLAHEVHTLKLQRVNLAQVHYETVLQIYQGGKMGFEAVFKAAELLAQAQYDAATTPVARLEVLAEAVQNAESSYAFAKGRFEGGGSGSSDMLLAKYGLLSAQLKLAEEKQWQAAPKDKR